MRSPDVGGRVPRRRARRRAARAAQAPALLVDGPPHAYYTARGAGVPAQRPAVRPGAAPLPSVFGEVQQLIRAGVLRARRDVADALKAPRREVHVHLHVGLATVAAGDVDVVAAADPWHS